MHRFYGPIESFVDGTLTLDPEETRHLRGVLRMRAGDIVSVFDGTGREFLCKIDRVNKKGAVLTLQNEIDAAAPESPLKLTAAVAVLNGEKYDLIIQKAVELGISTLVPLHTLRCEVRLSDASKRMERWRRIALGATKQSGRARIMTIEEPVDLERLLTRSDKAGLVLFSERNGGSFAKLRAPKKITAVFGPKGGWDDSELDLAASQGTQIVTLGGRILRVETAVIALTAVLQHRFGDLV